MVESVGKKLNQARLAKKLSIEDVANATKVRPDRVLDLENDDYTNFPNLAYAKGFLLIYARHLGVDVSEFAESFGGTNHVGMDDYDYLANSPGTRPTIIRHKPKRSSWPLLVIGGLLLALVIAGVIASYLVSFKRLGNLDQLANRGLDDAVIPEAEVAPLPTPAVAAPSVPAVTDLPSPSPSPPSAAEVLPEENVEVRRAIPIAEAEVSPATAAPAENELILQPLKKTWVKIQKDDENSLPIFEDWMFPDARPLTFRGTRFWVEVKEKDSVQIRKNGEVVNYDAGERIAIE